MATDIRYTVMKKVKTENVPTELNMFILHDPLSIDWTKFNFTGQEADYLLGEEDIKRPDLLSYRLYGTVIYQDVIFILNNIGDIMNVETNTSIKIPRLEDLKTFFKNNRVVE